MWDRIREFFFLSLSIAVGVFVGTVWFYMLVFAIRVILKNSLVQG